MIKLNLKLLCYHKLKKITNYYKLCVIIIIKNIQNYNYYFFIKNKKITSSNNFVHQKLKLTKIFNNDKKPELLDLFLKINFEFFLF